ncbi:glycosyltransferase family 8 protein [Pontibacter sp. CAU 1760]
MKSSSVVNIACVTDAIYVRHLGVTICSLLENRKYDYDVNFYILQEGLSKTDSKRLEALINGYAKAKCIFVNVDLSRYQSLSAYNHLSMAAYYRTNLPDILDKEVERILYLDCDLVVKDDIRELFEYDLAGKTVGAVENPEFNRYKELNIPEQYGYFNNGIMLIDVPKWKEKKISEKIFYALDHFRSSFELANQDSFNVALHDEWEKLPLRWNVQRIMFQKNRKDASACKEAENPAIIHYTSSKKPWDYLNNHPLRSEYYRYLKLSPWANTIFIPQDLTFKSVAKKLLRTAGIKQFQKDYW